MRPPSMFNAGIREMFQGRIDRLTPDSQRQWGKLTVDQMVCHLSDQLRLALGELTGRPVPGLFRVTPFNRLIIDYLPWPHGSKGPPESFTTRPVALKSDMARLHALLELFGAREDQRDWPEHPLFGTLSGPLWARLTCKHFDHHLRQFSV
jgi:hypothetical protein